MIRLSDLQLDIMQVLWQQGEASVADVQDALQDRGLAYTTVSTLLKRLEDRRVVARRREGRVLFYSPLVAETDVRRNMVTNLVDQLFRGDPAALVSHLLGDECVSDEDADRIRKLIERDEKDASR